MCEESPKPRVPSDPTGFLCFYQQPHAFLLAPPSSAAFQPGGQQQQEGGAAVPPGLPQPIQPRLLRNVQHDGTGVTW